MNKVTNATLAGLSMSGVTGAVLLADQVSAAIPLVATVMVELIRIFWNRKNE